MKVTLGNKGGRVTRSLAAKVTPVYASAAPPEDVEAEIARVAEENAPENGYGETAWNADSKTVYWVSADWSTAEEVDAAHAAFAAIDGVDAVEGDAEAALPSGDGWVQVWPAPRPTEAATAAERWEKLIEEELGDEADEPEPPPIAASVAAPSPLEQAFAMMGKLVEATANRPPAPAPVVHVHTGDNDPEQAFSTMRSMVEAFAARPDPPAPNVTVQPATAPDVHVHPAEISVNVPEQHAPDVHVSVDVPAQEAPTIAVHVPEIRVPDVHVQVEPPDVHVAAPRVSYRPPDVHVNVEQPRRPASVRLEVDEDGTRRFISEEEEE